MTTCPNTSSPDWIALVNAIGEDKAYDAYTLLGDIPNVKQARRLLSALKPIAGDKDANRFVSQLDVPETIQQTNAAALSQERINNGVSQAIVKFLNSAGVQLQAVNNL